MTFYAKKDTLEFTWYLAYFDSYSGKPITNPNCTIAVIKAKHSPEDTYVLHICLIWQQRYIRYIDSFIVTKFHHRDDVWNTIQRIARDAKFEYVESCFDPDKFFNPKRDYRSRYVTEALEEFSYPGNSY